MHPHEPDGLAQVGSILKGVLLVWALLLVLSAAVDCLMKGYGFG